MLILSHAWQPFILTCYLSYKISCNVSGVILAQVSLIFSLQYPIYLQVAEHRLSICTAPKEKIPLTDSFICNAWVLSNQFFTVFSNSSSLLSHSLLSGGSRRINFPLLMSYNDRFIKINLFYALQLPLIYYKRCHQFIILPNKHLDFQTGLSKEF